MREKMCTINEVIDVSTNIPSRDSTDDHNNNRSQHRQNKRDEEIQEQNKDNLRQPNSTTVFGGI
jgi:hypothetical protein